MKSNAAAAADLAAQLAADKKFRRQLLAAAGHGVKAQRQARQRVGVVAAVRRVAADEQLRAELRQMTNELDAAWARVQTKRSHRVRNVLLLVGVGGATAAAAAPRSREWIGRRLDTFGGARRLRASVIEAELEVEVPVSVAYNQWTQFEDFPLFMEGVDDVRQLDDTRLHWVASVAGRRAEWDAKILEQHPDRQISWISEDGKKTRGTVTFEPLGPSRSLVRLSMSYRPEGVVEAAGSAAGLDARRVKGDLERFKQLIETRGIETGAWRGDISAGASHEARRQGKESTR